MARVLYLHGSGGGPFGRRLSWLEAHGHPVVARPSLPYPQHRRWSWGWFAAFFDRRWFGQAVEAAQQAYDRARPDVVVGVSVGGAVAMKLRTGGTPQLLLPPGCRAGAAFRCGAGCRVKHAPRTWPCQSERH